MSEIYSNKSRYHIKSASRIDVISSVERITSLSKEQKFARQQQFELNKKMKEDKELSQCTFKPNVDKPEIDSSLKMDHIPGIDEHLRRCKVSNEKQKYFKHFYDNLGSKYTGIPTEMKPFNLTVSRERLLKENQQREKEEADAANNATKQFKNTIMSRAAKEKRDKAQAALEESKKLKQSTAQLNPREEVKSSTIEEKYAKLKIHYAKNKSAEIKVYENSDPEVLTEQFCDQYSLGSDMKKQLLLIIGNKIASLRPQILAKEINQSESENNEDSGDELDNEALQHYQEEIENDIRKSSKDITERSQEYDEVIEEVEQTPTSEAAEFNADKLSHEN